MHKFVLVFLILCSLAGLSSAQGGKPDGYIDVTFGHVRAPNGALISLKGLKLPYTIKKIHATKLSAVHGGTNKGTANPPPPNQTVYLSDAGSGYGYVDPGASCLDDITTLTSGTGVPWQTLMFGINVNVNHQFLVRWIVYDTYTTGAEPSAFSDVVADFGGYINGQTPGQYQLTVNVAPAGVVMDSATFYIAQQFRAPQADGNGAFDDAIGSVFNPTAAPQIGSSDNIFWYDQFDTGLYDDNMQDYFGDTSFANFLFGITVGGSQDTLVPFTYSIDNGTYSSGDVTSLWYTDQAYLKVQGVIAPSPLTPSSRVTVEGLASTATATSLTLSINTGTSFGFGTEKIELFNYSTNAWDLVDTEPTPTSDTPVNVTITNTPTRYVNQSTRHVKARVSFYILAFPTPVWMTRFDKINWIISHP